MNREPRRIATTLTILLLWVVGSSNTSKAVYTSENKIEAPSGTPIKLIVLSETELQLNLSGRLMTDGGCGAFYPVVQLEKKDSIWPTERDWVQMDCGPSSITVQDFAIRVPISFMALPWTEQLSAGTYRFSVMTSNHKIHYSEPFSVDDSLRCTSPRPAKTKYIDFSKLQSRQPSFEGGDSAFISFLHSKFNKKLLDSAETSGTIFASFIVDVNGNVTQPRIERSLTPLLDQELLQAIEKSPNWTPAYTLDIPFNWIKKNPECSIPMPCSRKVVIPFKVP